MRLLRAILDRAYVAVMVSLIVMFTFVAMSQIQAVYAQPALQPVVVTINSNVQSIHLTGAPDCGDPQEHITPVKVVVE